MKKSHPMVLLLLFFVLVQDQDNSAIGVTAGVTDPIAVIEQTISEYQWDRAESALLKFLWNDPSGVQGVMACEMFARVCVNIHKAPIAMEWLGSAVESRDVSEEKRGELRNRLGILHRVYLPGHSYHRDPDFHISGIEMESPSGIAVSEKGRIFLMDRYRLITLAPETDTKYSAVPPTTPLPEKSRYLKVIQNRPVIITDFGFWDNQKMIGFQGAGEIERIIDAVCEKTGEWLILDRRNTQMLRFDQHGRFIGAVTSETPNGDEKMVRHPLGGCWIMSPASRTIFTAGTMVEIRIPFKGPGYTLVDPIAMDVDWFGHLYVLNDDRTVSIFSPGGSCLRTITLDREDDVLKSPSAIAVGPDGSIYIADKRKHDVFRFQ